MNDEALREFERAVALHRTGRLAEAEQKYLAATKADPADAEVWRRLAGLYFQTGRQNETKAALERVIALQPGDAAAHATLGQVLSSLGQDEAALTRIQEAIALAPSAAEARNALGNVLAKLGRPDEALGAYDEAIALNPRPPAPWNNKGNALSTMGRTEEAIPAFRKALELKPDYAEALNNLGNALSKLGNREEAASCFRRSLALAPRYANAHYNYGTLLADSDAHEAAVREYRIALEINPNNAAVWNGLGKSLNALLSHGEALEAFQRASAADPGLALAYAGAGCALAALGRHDEARASHDKALSLDPSLELSACERFRLAGLSADWRNYRAMRDDLCERARLGRPLDVFVTLHATDDPALHLAAAKARSARAQNAAAPKRSPHPRLRVAYLSADFRDHPVAHHIAGIIESHDRGKFEIIGVCLHPMPPPSAIRERLKRGFDRFIEVGTLNDHDATRLLAERQIDLAVDLNGLTAHLRHGILAARPAPLTAGYLGYPGTSGAPFVDYLIGDRTVFPEGCEAFYTEKLVRLPRCFMPGGEHPAAAAPLSRGEAGLPDAGFVFCAFNSALKLTPDMFDVWMRLLQKTPQAVLWLNALNGEARENLKREAEARGVPAGRLVFADRLADRDRHFARLRLADVYLDTHPYGGHATANDFLRAGVPVITLQGRSFASRVAASMLHELQLDDLIATTPDDYVTKALTLADRPARLATAREKLASCGTQSSSLFDVQALSRSLEAAYLRIWEKHVAGEAPDHLSL